MRILWCYGSERFWNFCGRTIQDRAHPLANFIQSINRRRAVDCVPREFVAELLSHAERHGQAYVKEAVEYAIGTPKPVALNVRELYATLDFSDGGLSAPVVPALLLPALQQLSFPWPSIESEIRMASHSCVVLAACVCVCVRVCVCVCVCVRVWIYK